MTISRELKSPGRLILSPAVHPSSLPMSSAAGMHTQASDTLGKGTMFQRDDDLTGFADANGEVDLVFVGPAPGFKWKVERVVLGSVSGNFTRGEIHVGTIDPSNPFKTLKDTTPIPNEVAGDESSPIYVRQGQPLTVRFLGGNVDDDATAAIQYTEEKL
jgi:hypothetical protein